MADPQQTLAQMVRTKYPDAYKDLSDTQLEEMVLAKYPQYKDIPRTPTTPPAENVISAEPQPTGMAGKLEQWFGDLRNDVKYGGGRTMPGRALEALGAQPTANGVAPGVTEFMASPYNGLLRSGEGAAQVMQGKTKQGVKNYLGGQMEAATIPASFISPLEGEAVANAGGKIAGMIPSTERAGALFGEVAKNANKLTVALNESQEGALRLMKWQDKTQLGPTINKFLNRITSPKKGPLTYEEARDWYQVLGKLSAEENMKLPNAAKADLTKMVVGLKNDIGATAGQVGQKENYFQAMKQYSRAAKMNDTLDALKVYSVKELLNKAPWAALGYGAYKATR